MGNQDNYFYTGENINQTILNPYQNNSEPVHYLMYSTNQIAEHFGTVGPYNILGDNIVSGNPSEIEVNYLNLIGLPSLGIPTGPPAANDDFTSAELINIREKCFPQVIRATAGLLYWFATEVGSIFPPDNFGITSNQNGVVLSWKGVPNAASYQIWKRIKLDGTTWKAYNLFASVDGANTTCIDNTLNGIGFGPNIAEYKILSVDYQGTQSIFSNPIEILWGGNSAEKNSEPVNQLPLEFSVEQNFPNPFNPVTTIQYSVPEFSRIEISIFDRIGREVKTLVKKYQSPGYYSTDFDGSSFSSGLYFYRMKAGKFVVTKKMILTK